MASLAALGAYGSDEDSDEVETVPVLPVPHQGFSGMSLPLPQGHSAGASERAPDAKPARRTFQLPLPALKNSAAVKTDSESSDDEDAKRFAASWKGGGLLASLPAPKNTRASAQDTAPAVSASAYDDALARKKNPKQMAAALFEKQLQAKREQASKATVQVDDTGEDAEAQSFEEEGPWHGGIAADHVANAANPHDNSQPLPDGWGTAWDEAANAYYYYNSTGHTQWEAPSSNGGEAGCEQGDEVWVPSELRRELKKQAKRGREQMPNLAAMAPVITPSDLWQGEKYREYSAMSSAYHVPMHAPEQLKPGQLAKRKHQITDVLHQAAANELKYLDAAAQGRRSKAQCSARYGW